MALKWISPAFPAEYEKYEPISSAFPIVSSMTHPTILGSPTRNVVEKRITAYNEGIERALAKDRKDDEALKSICGLTKQELESAAAFEVYNPGLDVLGLSDPEYKLDREKRAGLVDSFYELFPHLNPGIKPTDNYVHIDCVRLFKRIE